MGVRIVYLIIEIEELMFKWIRDDIWRISMSLVSLWLKLLWNGNEVNLSIFWICFRLFLVMVDIVGMDMGGGVGDVVVIVVDIWISVVKFLFIWLSIFLCMVLFCEYCNVIWWVLEFEENCVLLIKL